MTSHSSNITTCLEVPNIAGNAILMLLAKLVSVFIDIVLLPCFAAGKHAPFAENRCGFTIMYLPANRKNSYWESIVYVNDDFYSKSAQFATPTNGGFGSELSHKEFLHKVQTVSLFVSAVDFDFVSDDFDPIKLSS